MIMIMINGHDHDLDHDLDHDQCYKLKVDKKADLKQYFLHCVLAVSSNEMFTTKA